MSLPIFITERDARRLSLLVRAHKTAKDTVHAENLKRLEHELARACILPETEMPHGVITMSSTVELMDLADRELFTYTLVFPESADAAKGRISVLAPLGTAMLGYRVGDEFAWPMPGGIMRVQVRRLIVPPKTVPYSLNLNGAGVPAQAKLNA